MDILGDNRDYGIKRVNLSGNRYTMSVMEKTKPFPLGVWGLIPVVTARRGGSKETCYAFANEGTCDALVDIAYAVDDLLDEAGACIDGWIGMIEELNIAIPAQDWGFTRVSYTPYDKDGNVKDIPIRLYLETSENVGSPETVSATVDLDVNGDIVRIGAKVYQEDRSCIEVIGAFRNGSPSVDKIEEKRPSGRTRLLYKQSHR